jgi:hypothetical protein
VELHLCNELGQPLERIPKFPSVVNENEQHSDRHATCNGGSELVTVDEIAAIAEDDGAGNGQHHVARERIELFLPVQAKCGADGAHDPALVARKLMRLTPESLRQAHRRQSLLGEAHQVGVGLL